MRRQLIRSTQPLYMSKQSQTNHLHVHQFFLPREARQVARRTSTRQRKNLKKRSSSLPANLNLVHQHRPKAHHTQGRNGRSTNPSHKPIINKQRRQQQHHELPPSPPLPAPSPVTTFHPRLIRLSLLVAQQPATPIYTRVSPVLPCCHASAPQTPTVSR
ncbi:unnamed protein product [Ectocarpus fasciculatus]